VGEHYVIYRCFQSNNQTLTSLFILNRYTQRARDCPPFIIIIIFFYHVDGVRTVFLKAIS